MNTTHEVICIDDSAQDAIGDRVAKGTIYRVREMKQWKGQLQFKLDGLTAGMIDGIERFFRADRFRTLAPDHGSPSMASAGSAHDPVRGRLMEALRHLPLASAPAGFLPVHIAAPVVLRLRRLADAAGIDGGADAFVSMVIGESVDDAASSTPQTLTGAADVIFHAYEFPPAERRSIARRLAAAARP